MSARAGEADMLENSRSSLNMTMPKKIDIRMSSSSITGEQGSRSGRGDASSVDPEVSERLLTEVTATHTSLG